MRYPSEQGRLLENSAKRTGSVDIAVMHWDRGALRQSRCGKTEAAWRSRWAQAWHFAVAACFWLGAAIHLSGQSTSTAVPFFDATSLREPTELGKTWLVHAGDDPAYARADFDDAGWARLEASRSLHEVLPGADPGIVWYRMHIKVAPENRGLALKETNISKAFEVYCDGLKLMQVGRVRPYAAYDSSPPLLVRIPDKQMAVGSIVVAVRVHLEAREWSERQPGIYSSNLVIGQMAALQQGVWLNHLSNWLVYGITAVVYLCLGLAALMLYTAQPRHREYLWLFLYGAGETAYFPVGLYLSLYPTPISWTVVLPALLGFWEIWFPTYMYFAFVGQRIGWGMRSYLTAVSLVSLLPYWSAVPASYIRWSAWIPPLLIYPVILIPLLLIHWRRGNKEAGILLMPLLLGQVQLAANFMLGLLSELPMFHETASHYRSLVRLVQAGPIAIYFYLLFEMLSGVALGMIILLRTNRLSRQGALLEGEIAAAREVQRVILPEAMEAIPGFTVESAYLPAEQVGGDFFQILPVGGGMLVVIGDVAGKGLPAAMMVSVLVGATRTAAAYSHAPAEVLAQLNDRLVGRANGGFSTALAVYFAEDGIVTMANAGHLSPYLDGEEVKLQGALPLGIVSDAVYETTQFELHHGSRLTLYSDGVVEAKRDGGELLGFERGRELSTRSAAAIVEEARVFGQCDDITVVAVARRA